MTDEPLVENLDEEQSYALLERLPFGRLAVAAAGEPDVLPVNFAVADRRLYFATAEGSKLLGLTINARVAFEADEITGDLAESVVVHGRARALETDEEIEVAQSLPLVSWVPTPKTRYVVITPTEVTGRRFRLRPERA